METQKTENPRVAPQNLVRENIQETKKENNEIERPSLIVNATVRYGDGLQKVANGFADLKKG